MRMRGALAALLLLTACGEPEERDGKLTSDEEQQLNDAAAMLDEPVDDDGGDNQGDNAEED